MALPKKLKNFNLFLEGQSFLGQVSTVTLPALARKMEAYRAAGMNGPVKVDFGMSDDGLTFEWTLGGWAVEVFKQFGITSASGVQLRYAGAVQRDDTGEVSAVEVVVRGRHETIDPGDAKPGDDTEISVTTVCTYYKLVVDGEIIIEIDLLNMIENVGGVDRLAEQRRAIGL